MQLHIKKIVPHFLVILGFVVLALAYFRPVLKGEKIFQSDIKQYIGMSKQQKDFKANTGEETYWTNGAFAGMPTYQLGARYPHNYIKKLDLILRFLPRPADYLFLYLLGFYIVLLTLKLDYKLAALGAIAFGFSTYLIIILGVGHNSKAHAIAYMPLVLSGIILTFQKKYITGFLLTVVAMGLELVANHFQMTYYLLLLVVVLGIVYFIDAYNNKNLKSYFKTIGVLILAVGLSIALNATSILATKQYVKYSTRGKSELTINADGSPKEPTNGLDKAYITQFSYGILETFNLFVPRFMGGGNGENVGKDSNTYNAFRKLGATTAQATEESKHAPMYWGDQPIVEAPAYIGAVVIFLFVLGLFVVQGRLKWWIISAVIMSLLLSYGKNFNFLTNFFIDYVPLYNKFRAVSSIQVILELCIPILSIFGLSKILKTTNDKLFYIKPLKLATAVTAGFAILFLIIKPFLSFEGVNDNFYSQNYGPEFIKAVQADRMAIFTTDTLRTLALVILAAILLFVYLKDKISKNIVVLGLGLLILVDLVGVGKRYVNNDDFVNAKQVDAPFKANKADAFILQDTTHYRVFDMVSGRSKPSYFHNSLNGYNAAELKRYRELFDFYVAKNNINVLNMLNTKYIVAKDKEQGIFPYTNPEANGNAWFVKTLQKVTTANAEIKALDTLKNKEVAVYSGNQAIQTSFVLDTLTQIHLKIAKPNYLKYESENRNKGFAVFSEIFYNHGWKTLIDGQPASHIRVNYTLRGMEIPAGKHIIEFKFDPDVVKTGSKIALASSMLFVVLLILGLFFEFKKTIE